MHRISTNNVSLRSSSQMVSSPCSDHSGVRAVLSARTCFLVVLERCAGVDFPGAELTPAIYRHMTTEVNLRLSSRCSTTSGCWTGIFRFWKRCVGEACLEQRCSKLTRRSSAFTGPRYVAQLQPTDHQGRRSCRDGEYLQRLRRPGLLQQGLSTRLRGVQS